MSTPTLNELWRRYLIDVVPAGAPEAQVDQAREGFYFGCMSLLVQLDKMGKEGRENGDREPLMTALMGWSAEGKQYAQAVKNSPLPGTEPTNQGDHDGH